jgi:hypothetical protein
MKDADFWGVPPYGSFKNGQFEGKYRLHHQCEKNQRGGKNVSNN